MRALRPRSSRRRCRRQTATAAWHTHCGSAREVFGRRPCGAACVALCQLRREHRHGRKGTVRYPIAEARGMWSRSEHAWTCPDSARAARLSGYGRSDYIGTGGWHLSPPLCGQEVTRHTGVPPVLLTHQPLTHVVAGTFPRAPGAPARARVSDRCDRLALPRTGTRTERRRPFLPLPEGRGLLAGER